MLTTNDQAGQIPVLVQARVESDVTVTPSVVQLGSVAPGTETVKTVLLRGHNPFVIEKVECESAHGLFKMPQLTKDAKTVHILPLTFTAPKESGPLSEKFIVTIAGRHGADYVHGHGNHRDGPADHAKVSSACPCRCRTLSERRSTSAPGLISKS